jgi:enoyl-CoA hydratase/carnithine racemase
LGIIPRPRELEPRRHAAARHALYYAVTGDTFDGKRAVEIGLANFAVPKAKLREETVALAQKLIKLNPTWCATPRRRSAVRA